MNAKNLYDRFFYLLPRLGLESGVFNCQSWRNRKPAVSGCTAASKGWWQLFVMKSIAHRLSSDVLRQFFSKHM